MKRFNQGLAMDGSRRFEFFYDNGKYWKLNTWSFERWELSQAEFEYRVSELPFFKRGTHIHTIHGEIMERVFVQKIKGEA